MFRVRSSWKSRSAVVGALLSVALIGGAASASAGELRELSGPNRGSRAEAQADIPGLQLECRWDGGKVVNSGVYPNVPNFGYYWAVVYCQY